MTRNRTVLVVDDDPILREVASEILRQGGFSVWTAEDGQLAMLRLALSLPDLVIMDMVMPNQDGIEAIQEVRRRWPKLPLIAVSAGTGTLESDVLLRAATELGANASMSKPLRAQVFLELVEKVLDRASASQHDHANGAGEGCESHA
ncbi:response regulator [soil metagenome]